MALPPLYSEGLLQHARRGLVQLQDYKLGIVEALLKDVLRRLDSGAEADAVGEARRVADAVREDVRTALDVVLWEMPPPWRDR